MNQTSHLPATIRARVHAGAIDRVTRFYANSLADTFAELLQNARRSGATRVDVTTEAVADQGFRVTVCDDGAGIADPAVLLSFGESGWDDATARREDPAGMGIYALSRRGCTVASRSLAAASGLASPGWSTTLTPECFLGKEDAVIVEADAPFPHGTSIAFIAEQPIETVRAALGDAARHYPLPVTCDGESCEHKGFLHGALHVHRWNGIVFGVFEDTHRGFHAPDLNFHGLTIAVDLPSVATVDGHTWTARADVDSCPDLELVLPARKQAVESSFLHDMRAAARLAIYRAMAAAAPTPRIAYTDQAKAARAGIAIADPPAELRRWMPAIADIDDWRQLPAFKAVDADSLVIAADLDAPDSQAFWRAAERAGLSQTLFEPDPRLEGYDWYDGLAKVHSIDIQITFGAFTHSLDALRNGTDVPQSADTDPRPDAIRFHLPTQRGSVPIRSIGLAADLAFLNEDFWSDIQDTRPLITADSAIAPHVLAQLLRSAFFCPSDDTDADSYETQKTRFDDDAMHLALTLLASEEDAKKHTIAETMYREVLWAIPRDRAVSITVNNGRIGIEFGPETAQSEGAPT